MILHVAYAIAGIRVVDLSLIIDFTIVSVHRVDIINRRSARLQLFLTQKAAIIPTNKAPTPQPTPIPITIIGSLVCLFWVKLSVDILVVVFIIDEAVEVLVVVVCS